MSKLLDTIDAETTIERTPEEIRYYVFIDTFNATLEELSADRLSKQQLSLLKAKLASDYRALIACPEHANHPRIHYVYEAVADSHGISRTVPLSKEEQRAVNGTYETEYLQASELGLIEAQNALRMPRLSKRQRKVLEDDVTFYSAELVCHERSFKSAARRRKCTKLIEEHKIDRTAPLQYHRA